MSTSTPSTSTIHRNRPCNTNARKLRSCSHQKKCALAQVVLTQQNALVSFSQKKCALVVLEVSFTIFSRLHWVFSFFLSFFLSVFLQRCTPTLYKIAGGIYKHVYYTSSCSYTFAHLHFCPYTFGPSYAFLHFDSALHFCPCTQAVSVGRGK